MDRVTLKFLSLILLTASIASAADQPSELPPSKNSEPAKIEVKKEPVYSEYNPDKPAAVYSKPCPWNCNDEGFSHSACKEWKEGDICFIGPKE